MVSQVLSLWMNKNSLDCEGDYVYGIFNDIGFSINDESSGKLLVMSVIAVSTDSYKKIQELCKMMGGVFSSIKIGRVEDYLALFIPDGAVSVTVADLDGIVQFVASNYESSGFVAHTKCFKCGKPSNRLTFKNQLVRPVCGSCASSEHMVSTTVDSEPPQPAVRKTSSDDFSAAPAVSAGSSFEGGRISKNSFNDNNGWDDDSFGFGKPSANKKSNFNIDGDMLDSAYNDDYLEYDEGSSVMGIVGSLLGAAVGLLPFLLIFSFTGNAVTAGCVLTSVVSALIYMLLKGKRSIGFGSTAVIASSAICSVLGTLFVLGRQYIEVADFKGGIIGAVFAMDPISIAPQIVIAVVGSILGYLALLKPMSNYCKR